MKNNSMIKKALFLDRDGIINVDHGYVYQQENFEFVDGIFDLCAKAQENDYQLIVITNQAGIARGYYSEQDFHQLSMWMVSEFNKQGIIITDVFFCPHHPTKGKGDYLQECKCRKPEPGMLFTAKEKHHVDLKQSIFIGDKVSDIKAAEAAGIHNRILVASQYGDDGSVKAHRVKDNFAAMKFID